MLPHTGSMITAAMSPFSPSSPPSNTARMAARSFHGTTSVSFAVPSVTPADPGIPSVATPDPAATRKLSPCP